MEIGPLLQNIGSFVRARPAERSVLPVVARRDATQSSTGDLLAARRKLLRVLESFAEVDRVLTGRRTVTNGLPSASSARDLQLDLTSSAARLESVAEINATPTSFAPFVPAWSGASTSLLTIGGIYDGSDGSGALSFEVRRGGVRGSIDRPRIRVRDPLGNIIRTFTIRENHALDRQYDLRNGLFLTAGTGNFVRFDTTSIQIYDSVGSVVDVGKPLNGSGNDNPNLEFGMPSIADGSLQVNGTSINVSAAGSLTDVVNAINQSAAGVTATFNPATERIEFVQNTAGSAPTIAIAGDDSNFVLATKLDTATVVPGVDPDTERPLDAVAQFAEVTGGDFLINSTPISVDPRTDTLTDVVDRINAAPAAVVATFDPVTRRIEINRTSPAEDLLVESNGTGLFAALEIAEGRIEPGGRGRGYSAGRAQRIADAVETSFSALNDFFRETKAVGAENRQVAALRNQLKASLANIPGLGTDGEANIFGINVNVERIGERYIDFGVVDRGELIRGLRRRGADVQRQLSGGGAGLLQVIGGAAQGALLSLNSALGRKGTLVDNYA
ncbi:MAG: flagellin hook IN motif-containing protein [Gammaproteobacteria bacterium]